MIRIIVFLGSILGSLVLGNYHLVPKKETMSIDYLGNNDCSSYDLSHEALQIEWAGQNLTPPNLTLNG